MAVINWGSESPEQLAIRKQIEEQALYEQMVMMAQADLVFRSSMQRAILLKWIETFPKSIFKYVSLNK